jgi:hypothetical protein
MKYFENLIAIVPISTPSCLCSTELRGASLVAMAMLDCLPAELSAM